MSRPRAGAGPTFFAGGTVCGAGAGGGAGEAKSWGAGAELGAEGPGGIGTTGAGMAGVGAAGTSGASDATRPGLGVALLAPAIEPAGAKAPGAGTGADRAGERGALGAGPSGATGLGAGVGAGTTTAGPGVSCDDAAMGFGDAMGAGRTLAGAFSRETGWAMVGFNVGADSVRGAPQNLQNAAVGSHVPWQRAHTRVVSFGGVGPTETTRIGAMGGAAWASSGGIAGEIAAEAAGAADTSGAPIAGVGMYGATGGAGGLGAGAYGATPPSDVVFVTGSPRWLPAAAIAPAPAKGTFSSWEPHEMQ